MLKKKLEELVNNRYSIAEISDKTGKSKTTVRYWLKKYGLKTLFPKNRKNFHYYDKKCQNCGEDNPDNFYGRMRSKCKKCFNNDVIDKQLQQKEKIVSHKGGKCEICGYNKYFGALELHHLDPNSKDPNFKNIRGWSWERVVKEIETCVLLCGNCHPEVHAGITKLYL